MAWPKGKPNPHSEGTRSISNQMRRVIEILSERGPMTARQLTIEINQIRPDEVTKDLADLMGSCCRNLLRRGLVERSPVDPDAKRRCYLWKSLRINDG